jgi:hypothetical protein
MGAFTLLAQLPRADRDPWRQPEVIWGTVGLIVALLAGAAVVYFVDRWRKRNEAMKRDTTSELTGFRGMYERGEITAEEYARLREQVARRSLADIKTDMPANAGKSEATTGQPLPPDPNLPPSPPNPGNPPDWPPPA